MQSEKNYLLKQTGLPTNTPIQQLRNVTWGGRDKERDWVRSQIVLAGGTPSGNFLSDLWVQLLVAKLLPVSTNISQNKKIFFESGVNL